MKYEIPKLNYGYGDLEPYIDAKTMEVHHTKHHQAYTDKLNVVLAKYPDLENRPVEELIKDIVNLKMEDADRSVLKNNGGGYINHNLFWSIMGSKKEIDKNLHEEIQKTFGSFSQFKEQFNKISLNHFGSGWTWLVRNFENKLQVYSLPNQDSPLSLGDQPILTLDLWEHAYYLKYQNRRQEYIENWWNVLKLI